MRKKIVVEEDGRVEIKSSELNKGDKIEVIMLVNPENETKYFLSTEANRIHLRGAR